MLIDEVLSQFVLGLKLTIDYGTRGECCELSNLVLSLDFIIICFENISN